MEDLHGSESVWLRRGAGGVGTGAGVCDVARVLMPRPIFWGVFGAGRFF